MLFKSIRSTTTAYLIVAIVLTCSVALTLSIQENKRISLESALRELSIISEYLVQELTPPEPEGLQNFQQGVISKALEKFKNIRYAAVYDANWQSQQSFAQELFDVNALKLDLYFNTLKAPPNDVVELLNNTFIMVTNIGGSLTSTEYLVVVSDASEVINNNLKSLLRNSLPMLIVLLTFFCALGFSLQRKLLRPLTLLSKFAKDVEARKDYSIKVKKLDKQELVELGDSINSMLRTINTEYEKSCELANTLKEHQKNIERFANFDTLTGFPNRQFFMETLRIELAKAMRDNEDLVLIYFELGGFKEVYECFGQEAGDQLLVKVCKRAKAFLREGDIISRLGDAEFLILLHNQPTDSMLVNIAERLIKELGTPFKLNSQNVEVTSSVGIAKASDSHFNLSEFIKNADIAMYRSKMVGINTHTMFVPDMMKDNKRKILIAASIAEAIQNDEFKVHYQTKVSKNEHVVGYDVSVHWSSEDLGGVPEAEFMTIAEQNGKTPAITKWVLEAVCQDLPIIHQQSESKAVFSINLSTVDIQSSSLIDFIKNTFAYYQVNPAHFEFKLSESAFLENQHDANEFLKGLRQIGAGVALDHFGSGYASLGYLSQVELTAITIDKQFIDNLMVSKRSTLVVKTIMKIAKQLDVQVCADGVETREQVEFLAAAGCQQMQGFLFSKPVDLVQLLRSE